MAGPTQQTSTSTKADDLIRELTAKSTFPASTIRAYANKFKHAEHQDAKFVQFVERALADLEKVDRYDYHLGRPPPADLASILEIWQETDRPAAAAAESAKASMSPLLQSLDDASKALEHQAQLSEARGRLHQHYTAVSLPHLPCTQSLDALQAVDLSDLELASHNRGRSIAVYTVGPLLQRETRMTGAVVDRAGNVAFLELTCVDTDFAMAMLHDKASLVIKEPFATAGRDVAWCVRVDHPTDLVKLGLQGPCTSDTTEWKELGNRSFKKRELGAAATAYENGLRLETKDQALIHDLHRNLAQTYLSLGFWDLAKLHAGQALDWPSSSIGLTTRIAELNISSSATSLQNRATTGQVKALYRSACAAYCLHDFTSAKEDLQQLLKLAPEDEHARQKLLKVYKRLSEQEAGSYDFDEILSSVSPQKPDVDAANFTRLTQVSPSAGRGNGLFAADDFRVGDLVLCEKAFAADFCLDPSQEPMRTYDTSRELFGAVPAALWIKAAQKAIKNPSLAPLLLNLGGNHAGLGQQELFSGHSRIVDVFQVHDIITRNSFGVPTPCASARTDQWGVYTSQSGADGSTNLAPRNSAIFCHAAFINHSCLPNVEKRSIGDLIIIRATRPIRKGEELFLDYAPGEFPDARSRKQGFERTWQFSCDCKLCEAESKQPDEVLDQRVSLTGEANALSEELSRNLPQLTHRHPALARLEQLAEQLSVEYDKSELPKSLAYTYTTLALLYGARKDFTRHVKALGQGFESLGWQSPLVTGGSLIPKPDSATCLDLNIPQLLYDSVVSSAVCIR